MPSSLTVESSEPSSARRWHLLLWLSVGVAALLAAHDATRGSIRGEALVAGLRLCLAAACLCLAGWSVAVLGGLRRFTDNSPLLIGLGQVMLMALFYLRSLIANIVDAAGIASLPLSVWELLGWVAVLTYCAARKSKEAPWRACGPSFAWVGLALLIVAQRELPRTLMLSTDPDQHLFWTVQVLDFGRVPFSLGDWGGLDFGYPAGFAVLSALWTWLSFQSADHHVAAMPLLQSVLAVLAIAGLVKKFARIDTLAGAAVLYLLALSLFFGFFPFGLLKEFSLLQKTGSLSTQLVFVVVVALVFLSVESPVRQAAPWPALWLAALGVGWGGLINPVAFVLPAMVFYAGLLVRLKASGLSSGRMVAAILVLAVVPLALILSDPYYIFRFLVRRPVSIAEVPPGFLVQPLNFWGDVGEYVMKLLRRAEFVRPLLQLQYFAHPLLAVAVMGAAIGMIMRFSKGMRLRAAVGIGVVPVLCVVLEFLLLPPFYAARNRGDLYMLEPYFYEALNRMTYLWAVAILLLALAFAIRWALASPPRLLAVVGLVAVLFVPIRSLRDRLPSQVDSALRYERCDGGPALACSAADEALIKPVNETYEQERALRQASGSDEPMPRVLIPNRLVDVWRERWLFPVGASRSLPAHTKFPLAFFYYKGDRDFSYRNYVERVCERFDVDWLKAHRVKYLYIPADADGACIAGLTDIQSPERVIAQKGRAMFIRLY